MRTRSRIAAAAAAGVVATGLVVVPAAWSAVDMMSGAPVRAEDRPGPGWGHMGDPGQMMNGTRPGSMMRGARDAAGPCGGMLGGTSAKGTLSADQQQTLARQAEQEKLAHDLYVAFAESTGDSRFEHVARSESMHLWAIRSLLERYGLDDPTEGLGAGEFTDDEVAAAYDGHLASGSESLAEALRESREVERADIAVLRAAIADVDAPDVDRTLAHLLMSSRMHLQLFGR